MALMPILCVNEKTIVLIATIEFSVIHYADNVDNFVLLKFQTKGDEDINHIKFNLKHYVKYKLDLKLIWYLFVFQVIRFRIYTKLPTLYV